MLGELAGMKCIRFVSDLAHLPRELKIQQVSNQQKLSPRTHDIPSLLSSVVELSGSNAHRMYGYGQEAGLSTKWVNLGLTKRMDKFKANSKRIIQECVLQ